jgi:hypothetical protein
MPEIERKSTVNYDFYRKLFSTGNFPPRKRASENEQRLPFNVIQVRNAHIPDALRKAQELIQHMELPQLSYTTIHMSGDSEETCIMLTRQSENSWEVRLKFPAQMFWQIYNLDCESFSALTGYATK